MGRTILTDVRGFTPVIDEIVEDLGLMPAVIFGRVWRYCQMKDDACSASLERIGGEVGVSRKTVERYIKVLCKAGYLEDTTPDRRNRPHVYKDTGKVRVWGQVAAEKRSDRESEQVDRSDRESEHYDRESDLGKTESRMKIEEDTTQDTTHMSRQNFGMLARICKIDLELMTQKMRGRLNQVEGKLRNKKGATTEDIKLFGIWWYKHWWQGRDGQAPRPEQICDKWGEFNSWRSKQNNKGVMQI